MGLYKNTNGNLDLLAGGTLYADAPVGSIQAYGGATAPFGWLLCQGQAVSRATYAELFGVIGTSFGAGDGSTTFNVPDLRDKVLVGVSATDTNINAIGKTYGEKTHTLTVDEMPSHAHGLNNHTHSIPALTGTAASEGGHTHTLTGKYGIGVDMGNMGVGSGNSYTLSNPFGKSITGGAHTHSVTTNASTTGAASGNTAANGSGNSHNIMQPSTAVNYIIKAQQTALPLDIQEKYDELDNRISANTLGTAIILQNNTNYTTLSDGYFVVCCEYMANTYVYGIINGTTVIELTTNNTTNNVGNQYSSLFVKKGSVIKYYGSENNKYNASFVPLT